MIPGDKVLTLFQNGPVLLVVDGDDPAHSGLPAGARGHYVIAPLVGAWHRDALMRSAGTLECRYGTERGEDTATLRLEHGLALLGRGPTHEPAGILNPQRVAALGDNPGLLIHQMLSALRLAPPQPSWNFPGDEATMAASAPAHATSKREAVEAARAGNLPCWLGLNLQVPGLRVVASPMGGDVHNVLLMPDTAELRIDDAGLAWRQVGSSGTMEDMRVPYEALWGVQSFDAQTGYCWPAQLSPSLRATLQGALPAWPTLAGLECVTIAAPTPLRPSLLLGPPPALTPREAVDWALQQGPLMVVVDRTDLNVRVPANLREQAVVAIVHQVGLPTSLVVDDDLLVANLPDANGAPGTLRAPWTSVVAVQSMAPFAQPSWTWPGHVSASLMDAMQLDADGTWRLSMQQPCGAQTPAGRPMLEVALTLPRLDVH